MYDDELMHYGVKGMKWGVRRDTYYGQGSRHTKRLRKKALKAERKGAKEKAERYRTRASASLEVDRARRDYIMKSGKAKQALKAISFAPISKYAYDSARAVGKDRISAYGHVLISGVTRYPYFINRGAENAALRKKGLK